MMPLSATVRRRLPLSVVLHDDDGDAALVQLLIQVRGVGVPPAVGVVPVHEVHLDLDEVPMVLPAVVQADEFVELAGRAVEGEAQVADAARLLFLDEEIHHSVLHVALFESGHTVQDWRQV